MATIKCKKCGATIETNNDSVIFCGHCGTQQELTQSIEEKSNGAEARGKKTKKVILGIALALLILAVTIVMLVTVIVPNIKYNNAVALMSEGKYLEAAEVFAALGNHKDSEECKKDCYATLAKQEIEKQNYKGALGYFFMADAYEEFKNEMLACWEYVAVRETIATDISYTVAVKQDGTVEVTEYTAFYFDNYGQVDVLEWSDIIAVDVGLRHTVGLKSDGTVVAVGDNAFGQCEVSEWTDIVAVSAGGEYTIGLKADGTVVATKPKKLSFDQNNVAEWTDIIAISADYNHIAGLKYDGTVVATGSNDFGECDVSHWTDIVRVLAKGNHTFGVKSDGTVVAVGHNDFGQCDVSEWTDIAEVSAGIYHTIGLKKDGTLVTTAYRGAHYNGQSDVSEWKDIIAISTITSHTVGLKSDGTVVVTKYTGENDYGQCNVGDWTEIKLPTYITGVIQHIEKPEEVVVNPVELGSAKVGDIVALGKYEQDDNTGNGQEDIEWIVLEKTDGKILVVSKYALDTKKFHNSGDMVTWGTSDIRDWLNKDFVDSAFTKKEKARISTVTITDTGNATEDKVFLMSVDEVKKYFSTDEQRKCAPTKSAEIRVKENASWTLRTSDEGGSKAYYVNIEGSIESRSVEAVMSFVRPAMWIEIE